MKKFLTLGCLVTAGLIVAMALSSCATVLTSIAQKAWESRSTEDQVTDAKIHTGILDKLKNKDKGLLLDVSIDVWEQRVLITGTLDNSELRSEVESLARQDSRIKILHNHIQIVTPEKKEANVNRKKKAAKKRAGKVELSMISGLK